MDIVFFLEGAAFEWDAQKAQSNIEKHGIVFEEAAEVFFDPFYQTGMLLEIKKNVISSSVTLCPNVYYLLFL